MKKRAAHGGRQANSLKYNRIMNQVIVSVAAIPFLLYCLPVVIAWILAAMSLNVPHLGLMLGVPFVWMPSVKAVAIIMALNPYRRAIRYWWKRINASDNVQPIRARQTVSTVEISKNDSRV
jgi:hypothetical protein